MNKGDISFVLDEGKLPDGPESDMSMFLQQERNRQREVEDSMHKKREFFQSLMGNVRKIKRRKANKEKINRIYLPSPFIN